MVVANGLGSAIFCSEAAVEAAKAITRSILLIVYLLLKVKNNCLDWNEEN
jgi:hypothetical protein